MRVVAKTMKGKLVALNIYVSKEEKSQIDSKLPSQETTTKQ